LVYYFNPSAAVAAFITDPNGRLLVARRAKNPAQGTLDLPGGFVDPNETGEEAVIREVREETGLSVSHLQYIFSLPNIYPYSGFDVHTLDLFYRGEVGDPSGLRAADDVEELFFLSLNEIRPEKFGLDSIRKAVTLFINLK
jgi:ADP-ribose pyrophosphatase YjhB (NUDIX family)